MDVDHFWWNLTSNPGVSECIASLGSWLATYLTVPSVIEQGLARAPHSLL